MNAEVQKLTAPFSQRISSLKELRRVVAARDEKPAQRQPRRSAGKSNEASVESRLLALLEANGPATIRAMEKNMSIPYQTIAAKLSQKPELFKRIAAGEYKLNR